MSMSLEQIHKIYNEFPEGQTMLRHEFVKEMQRLTSQSEVNKDLRAIMMRKRIMAQEKQKIDRVIENG